MAHDSVEVTVGEEDIEPDPQSPEADDLLAGKFKTTDDLVKAYKELESKLGSIGSQESGEAPETPPAPERPDGTIDTSEPEVPETLESFTLADVVDELSESGTISDETYERLKKEKGLSRADVDTWAEGIKARGERLVAELNDAAGGPEAFRSLLDWAKTGLPKEEIEAYNEAVGTGNATLAKMLLRSMRAQYEATNGREPNLVGGENVPQRRGVKPFTSLDQLTSAMGDPRYRTDPTYRAEVDKRVAASDIL